MVVNSIKTRVLLSAAAPLLGALLREAALLAWRQGERRSGC